MDMNPYNLRDAGQEIDHSFACTLVGHTLNTADKEECAGDDQTRFFPAPIAHIHQVTYVH